MVQHLAVPVLLLLLPLGRVLGAGDGSGAYGGFDCGQGSAILVLASHRCSSEAHQHVLSCFNSLALRVKRCGIKAWPHPHHGRKQACWGVQLVANVTDVNTAQGALHLHGSSQHVPVQLEYRRPDEAMHVTISGGGGNSQPGSSACTLVFDVRSASEASLHPIPGEDGRRFSSLLALLVPVLLVPCLLVGLIVMAVGSLSAPGSGFMRHAFGGSAGGDADGADSGDAYDALPGEEQAGGGGGGGAAGGASKRRAGAGGGAPGGLGLLKAMSRRARARRMRRSCRPAYVGLPEQSAQQHREYVSGRLQPGPFNLVAPFFKFPPVAVPPALEAIPESATPTSSSRASSAQDLTLPMAAAGAGGAEAGLARRSPPPAEDDELLLLAWSQQPPAGGGGDSSSSFETQLPQLGVAVVGSNGDGGGGGPSPAWVWVAPRPAGDAEEGGC